MPVSVTLPALGESVTEGTVTRWLKQVGDTVQTDEPLLEVSTDKVDTEIPAPTSGVLLQITVGEDETVAVGAELGVIGDAGEDAGSAAPASEAPAEASAEAAAPATEPEPEAAAPEPAPEPEAAPEPEPVQAEAAPEPTPEQAPEPAAAAASDGGAETSVTLPALGESVTEGTVTRWLKQVGDSVQVDEPLLEVSTDKVDTEIPSPAAGTLVRITVGEDETVAVGAELGVIGGDQGAAPKHAADEPPAPAPQAEQPVQVPEQQPPAPPVQETQAAPPSQPAAQSQPPASQAAPVVPAQAAPPNGEGASQYVTPLVRKLAAEHDIDLSAIKGTGVGGRIRKQDVLEAAEAKKAAAAAPAPAAPQAPAAAPAAPAAATAAASELRGTTQKLTRMRKIIAQRLVESMQVSAQLTSVVEVDVTQIARLRNKVKNDFLKQNGVKLSFLPFFAKAAVEALKIHPKLNASMDVEKGEVTYHDAEHLVVAVDTERGLLVPVVHNAGDLNIAGLTKKIADLAERARTNKLVPDELAGGTFTLTNTGSRGALFDTPIFFQPQVAILGTGAVVKRAVVIDDEDLGETIAVRHMMYLALSYDHRLVDGADAARFLGTIKERLEDGKFEAEFGL